MCVYLGSFSSLMQSDLLKKTFMPNNTITENSHRQHNTRTSK